MRARYAVPDLVRAVAGTELEEWRGRQVYRGRLAFERDLLERPYRSDLRVWRGAGFVVVATPGGVRPVLAGDVAHQAWEPCGSGAAWVVAVGREATDGPFASWLELLRSAALTWHVAEPGDPGVTFAGGGATSPSLAPSWSQSPGHRPGDRVSRPAGDRARRARGVPARSPAQVRVSRPRAVGSSTTRSVATPARSAPRSAGIFASPAATHSRRGMRRSCSGVSPEARALSSTSA